MSTGIILTAGKSTRLENKVLLPIKGGVMFESALNFLRQHETIENIVVVQDRSRVVESYWKIRSEYYEGDCPEVEFVVQPKPVGISDALNRAAILCSDNAVITFGDNRYPTLPDPHTMSIVKNGIPDYCTYISYDAQTKLPELDRYEPNHLKTCQWSERDNGVHKYYLAGFLGLKRSTMEDMDGPLINFLNDQKIKGVKLSAQWTNEWMDLGTVPTYQTYLNLWRIHEA